LNFSIPQKILKKNGKTVTRFVPKILSRTSVFNCDGINNNKCFLSTKSSILEGIMNDYNEDKSENVALPLQK